MVSITPSTIESLAPPRNRSMTLTVMANNVRITKGFVRCLGSKKNKVVFEVADGSDRMYLKTDDNGFDISIRKSLACYSINNRPLCRYILKHYNAVEKVVLKLTLVSPGYFLLTVKDKK